MADELEVIEPLDDPAYAAAREFALNCSGEPLPSREAIVARLRELEAWGVDLSLVQASLALTPTERLAQNARMVEFARSVRVVGRSTLRSAG
ncbi:MAG TPA: hypothetical protein VMW62_10355 [Chloroflexota bacterium]|nr:hypothetical protein [Chloroflexota bacterium]